MKKTSTNNNSFSEKHPVANFVLGCFILFSLLIAISSLLFLFLSLIGKGLNQGAIFLKHFVSMKMSTFNAKVFSCFFTFSNMHISKQLYLCILYNYMFLMGVGVGSGSWYAVMCI